ncbi:hypothetical protein CY34DRAFT_806647 [Suillus luteus UH-Slu-Lm8-n1]|uniref:Uncharacterized protein n=1 Tax=Suillus luteus UH-Slu-Lm8-n1 TaxID=930992 RepID=A0A0D0AGT9_9AGAM|nr:hypothetical protein CY34DRAFT_806647 [Suillus luteus UH-Slu-Lm8-n1]
MIGGETYGASIGCSTIWGWDFKLKNWDAVRTSMYRKGGIKVECQREQQLMDMGTTSG